MSDELEKRPEDDPDAEVPTTLTAVLDRAADVPIAEVAAAFAGAGIGTAAAAAIAGHQVWAVVLAPVVGLALWVTGKARNSAEHVWKRRSHSQADDWARRHEAALYAQIEEEVKAHVLPEAKAKWVAEWESKYDYVIAQFSSGEWNRTKNTVSVRVLLTAPLLSRRRLGSANAEPASVVRAELRSASIEGGKVTLVNTQGRPEIETGSHGEWTSWEFASDSAPQLNVNSDAHMLTVDVRLLVATARRDVECRGSMVVV